MEQILTNSSGFQLLLCIGACHRRLKQHAICVSEIVGVQSVKFVSQMPDLCGYYRIEEYVDAELFSGEAISWCLEITITDTCVYVEADVRRIHSEGQDVEAEIGKYQFSTESDCTVQISDIAERLCSVIPAI